MSIHQVECAALLRLRASTKLVLMAYADSADKDTRVAFPGLDNVMKWSGLRKSRALEVTNWLVQEGYLARLGGSKPGRRAEYLVFPAGCCAQHGPLHGYAGPDPLRRAGQPETKSSDASGLPDVNNPDGSGPPDVENLDGAAAVDAFESGPPDPFPPDGSGPWSNGSNLVGERVHSRADPSPPPSSVSPPPPARGERPRTDADGPGGGGGGGTDEADSQGRARRFFDQLGSDWTLSASQRDRLTSLVLAALQRGWRAETLAACVGANVAGVRNPYAVLRSRLADLPDPPASAPSRPPWCGGCDHRNRLREDREGRPARCPECHPLSLAADPAQT